MANPSVMHVASIPIFRWLSPEDRAAVASVAELRSFRTGEEVFTEGEPSNVILAILSGSVGVKAASGPVLALPSVLHPGDPFGDVGALEGGPYPATGTALEATECLVIPRADFFRLLEQNPTLVRGFVHGLIHRIVELTRELRQR